ncbi:hypothetical protein XU18_1093 [Perkinsela sp. CCAP 1560/4]|nr:hypothetical protein XU18_1093 [Perkinsela sp. CCAP 1560/4]|eukprot:KNH08380.1 hypothetical protein XU18_1093 [Perkinsela sp. CCAP 1560/4]
MYCENSSPTSPNTAESPVQGRDSSEDEQQHQQPHMSLTREERVRIKKEKAQHKMLAMRSSAEEYLANSREKYQRKICENEQQLESLDEPAFQKQEEILGVVNIHERIDCLLNHTGIVRDAKLDNIRRILKLKYQSMS